MVWSMSYRPKPDSYPMAEVAEGNSGELELEDMTDDGGVGLRISRSFSVRRAKSESVPKVIRWMSKRPLLDYEDARKHTVSDRFRDLIEEIEPGIHQFEPIRFIAKDRSPLADRWFWQVCNRLDSVNREKSDWVLLGRDIQSWSPPSKRLRIDGKHHLVFSLTQIGDAQFWHDKHISTTLLVSNAARSRIEATGITGVHLHHYDQA